MALYKKNGVWWIDTRLCLSTETTVKAEAQRLHDKLENYLTKQEYFTEKPINIPAMRPRKTKSQIRWLTREAAQGLLEELPPDLRDMVAFTLETGLRQSEITDLQWKAVSMAQRCLVISAQHSNKVTMVPLSDVAMTILERHHGNHPIHVFTHKGKPIACCNNRAWKNALACAGITDFRWHDLRHTWAVWHAQNGTPLQELQRLAGWSSDEMVLRYAHFSSQHSGQPAEQLAVTNL